MKRQRRRAIGLKTKLILAMCGMAVFSVAIVTLISMFLLRSSSMDSNRAELEKLTELVRPWATGLVEKGENNIVSFPSGVNPERVIVFDKENRLLYPQENPPEFLVNAGEHTLDLILSGRTVAQSLDAVLTGSELFLYGVPVRNLENNVIGGMILVRPVKEIFSSESQSLKIMFMSMGVAIALAILLSLLITASITTPLSELRDAAINLASGDFSTRSSVKTRDELGQLSESFNFLSDRLKTTVDALENEKQRLIGILASISEGIIAIDAKGNILHANPAAYLLFKLKENDEANLLEHLSETPVLRSMAQVSQTLARRDDRFITGNGSEIVAAISPVTSMGGESMGAVCVLRDISAAERLEKMRRDYVANISHEFRAPITGIRGFIEPLLDGIIDSPEERFECYKIIHNETLRLERLINDTLDLSRLQNAQYELETEPMDIGSILQNVLKRFSELATKDHLHFTYSLPEAPQIVQGNEDRIEQVLVILLDNAIKYTPEGGSIQVDTQVAQDEIAIRITDTGIGIPEADLPYIFERFYKGDKSRSMGGTGLGLAIANEISQLLNGRIVVHSVQGEGSRFEFWLPLA